MGSHSNAQFKFSGEDDQLPAFSDPQSVSVMLDLVRHLRHQDISSVRRGATKWDQNFWLPSLDYLAVAQAALSRSAHFSAVIYADIWCQKQRYVLMICHWPIRS